MRWTLRLIVAAAAALPAAAMAQGGQQSTTGATGMRDTTITHRTDTTVHVKNRKHHRRHRMTNAGEVRSDTSNQTQSGMVNDRGTSTLGKNMKKTHPTANAPVTAKGDTLRRAGDSTGNNNRTHPYAPTRPSDSTSNQSSNPTPNPADQSPSTSPNPTPNPTPSPGTDGDSSRSTKTPTDSTKPRAP